MVIDYLDLTASLFLNAEIPELPFKTFKCFFQTLSILLLKIHIYITNNKK